MKQRQKKAHMGRYRAKFRRALRKKALREKALREAGEEE